MTEIVLALVPVFLLIAIGYAIRRTGFISEAFWAPADKITFYVFFPALLFRSLASADLEGLPLGGAVAALVLAILAVTAILLLLRTRLGLDGPAFTSVLQGGIRPNTYVGLAAALALFGAPGLSVAAVAIVAFVPLVNVISTTVLARFASDGGTGWRATARVVAANPLILACLGGIAVNLAGLRLPPVVDPLLDILGRPALVLGLISVGAGLDLAAARGAGRTIAATSAFKLLALPAFAALGLSLLGVSGLTATVALLFAALPTSATSYVMARLMGGDHALMAGIITVETLLATATLPLWLIAFGGTAPP